jgi:hypothetical protein
LHSCVRNSENLVRVRTIFKVYLPIRNAMRGRISAYDSRPEPPIEKVMAKAPIRILDPEAQLGHFFRQRHPSKILARPDGLALEHWRTRDKVSTVCEIWRQLWRSAVNAVADIDVRRLSLCPQAGTPPCLAGRAANLRSVLLFGCPIALRRSSER